MAESQDFIRDLNAALAIVFQDAEDRFELDRHGMVTIDFNGLAEVVLQAVPDSDTALLSAEVCPISGDDTALLRRALEANLFKVTPPGAFLALDPAKAVLTLCQGTGSRAREAAGLMACLTAFVAGIGVARATMLSPAVGAESDLRFGAGVSDIIISG
jgi:hypothetical protein